MPTLVKPAAVIVCVFFLLPLAVAGIAQWAFRAHEFGERIARSWQDITLTCAAVAGLALLAGAVCRTYAVLVGATCLFVLASAWIAELLKRDGDAATSPSGAALLVPRPYLNSESVDVRIRTGAVIGHANGAVTKSRLARPPGIPLGKVGS